MSDSTLSAAAESEVEESLEKLCIFVYEKFLGIRKGEVTHDEFIFDNRVFIHFIPPIDSQNGSQIDSQMTF